jgi:hypothetical protein
MKTFLHTLKATVWLYPGKASWYFITIEKEDAAEIKADYPWPRKGFGSIPVNVTIGKTTWKTSVFPEKKGTYLLPIKKEVRDKEEIDVGDELVVTLQVEA